MTSIPESELILNTDGSIYHLKLHPDQIARNIITVGDPNRVSQVSRHFDQIVHRVQNREFLTHTGLYNGREISVVSTGIGTANIDIVINELDALVNIDLHKRIVKDAHTSLRFIRMGTSGSIQEDLSVGQILVSKYAMGFGGLLHFYGQQEDALSIAFQDFSNRNRIQFPSKPYGCKYFVDHFDHKYPEGITLTMPGFYGPQGRILRINSHFGEVLKVLPQFVYDNLPVTNIEMETAGIYAMAHALGHEAISFNAILANRVNGTFADKPNEIVDHMIKDVLDSGVIV